MYHTVLHCTTLYSNTYKLDSSFSWYMVTSSFFQTTQINMALSIAKKRKIDLETIIVISKITKK